MRVAFLMLAATAACAGGPAAAGPAAGSASAAGAHARQATASARFAAATAFLPPEYECELFADWAAMRDLGLLDELERLPGMEDFLAVLAGTYFCEPDQLLRTRTAMVFDWSGSRPTNREVSVAQGRDLKPPAEAPVGTARVRIGGWDAVQVQRGPVSRPTAVWPSPSLVVVGGHDLLEPVLRGERGGGVPHPDLLPLALGDGILAQAVVCGLHGRPALPFDGFFFVVLQPGGTAAVDVDAARLRLAADADERLTLSVTLRFVQGSEQTASFAQGWRDRLAGWARTAPPAARRVLDDVSVTEDGRDVCLAVELGSPREAIGKVQDAALAVMAARSR